MPARRAKTRKMVARHAGGAPRTHESCPLGKRIEELAAARGLTLIDVAGIAGLHAVSMNDIRRGRYSPRLETLGRIASALRVQPADLLSGG